jgi:hypothetical protein
MKKAKNFSSNGSKFTVNFIKNQEFLWLPQLYGLFQRNKRHLGFVWVWKSKESFKEYGVPRQNYQNVWFLGKIEKISSAYGVDILITKTKASEILDIYYILRE